MAFTRSPLSLTSRSTGTATGRAIALPRGQVGSKSWAMQVTLTNSTKASVRLKGSVDGIAWKAIGTANSTVTSTSSPLTVLASTTFPYNHVRVDQVSMVASTKGSQTITASVSGA